MSQVRANRGWFVKSRSLFPAFMASADDSTYRVPWYFSNIPGVAWMHSSGTKDRVSKASWREATGRLQAAGPGTPVSWNVGFAMLTNVL